MNDNPKSEVEMEWSWYLHANRRAADRYEADKYNVTARYSNERPTSGRPSRDRIERGVGEDVEGSLL
jgi:hypothetical protein